MLKNNQKFTFLPACAAWAAEEAEAPDPSAATAAAADEAVAGYPEEVALVAPIERETRLARACFEDGGALFGVVASFPTILHFPTTVEHAWRVVLLLPSRLVVLPEGHLDGGDM